MRELQDWRRCDLFFTSKLLAKLFKANLVSFFMQIVHPYLNRLPEYTLEMKEKPVGASTKNLRFVSQAKFSSGTYFFEVMCK